MYIYITNETNLIDVFLFFNTLNFNLMISIYDVPIFFFVINTEQYALAAIKFLKNVIKWRMKYIKYTYMYNTVIFHFYNNLKSYCLIDEIDYD